MTIRTLIVDDASLAGLKARASGFLREHSDFEIVGETGGRDVAPAVVWLEPDFILADADILGMEGIRKLGAREISNMPNVVFVSAHEEHAVDAFDLGVVDYLVKPFSKDRWLRPQRISVPLPLAQLLFLVGTS
jgi:two-component system LytT family response regulator